MTSTSYPQNEEDWKGRFIFDMAAALGSHQGLNLSLWAPPGPLPAGTSSALSDSDSEWLSSLAQAGGMAHLLRTRPWSGLSSAINFLLRSRRACRRSMADSYHVNWLQNVLGLPDDGRPAVITVLGSDYQLLDLPVMSWLIRQALKRRPAVLAPNAPWMAKKLTAMFGDVARVQPIPFGVHEDWFRATRTGDAPSSVKWLVVTRITRAKIGDLFAWGETVLNHGVQLELFGPMQEDIPLPSWITYRGPTHPAELKAYFAQAAGLITLSRHPEGRPQVLIEAMAAGLPVIASDLPAHRDLIRHGETGWIVDTAAEFRSVMELASRPDRNQSVGGNARDFIRQEIGTWKDCAERYFQAHQQLDTYPCH